MCLPLLPQSPDSGRQYSRKREVDRVQKASVSKDFERQVKKLIDLNYVRKEDDRVWLVEQT